MVCNIWAPGWRLYPTAHTDEYDLQGVQEIACLAL